MWLMLVVVVVWLLLRIKICLYAETRAHTIQTLQCTQFIYNTHTSAAEEQHLICEALDMFHVPR